MPRISVDQAGGQNVCSLLDAIAWSEIGAQLLAETDDGYNVLVGSVPSKPLLFSSYADHPDIYSSACNSTAAGRYQILHTYWPHYKTQLHLPDFGPVSQDLYAIQQIKERGAYALILAGHLRAAVQLISNIWASLPGSPYGQHTNSFSDVQAAYLAAGGSLADCEATA